MELYVHIPFCVKKCAYCDFLSFPQGEEIQRRYVEKLMEEIRTVSAGFHDTRFRRCLWEAALRLF